MTAAGAGGWKGGSSASTVLTGANADHFAMSAAGVLTPTAAFVANPQASYTLGATIGGAAVTIAVTTLADTITVASDAEADALDWAGMSGRTVAFRGPLTGGPAKYNVVRPGQQYCSAAWWNVRDWAETVTCRSADPADRATWLCATSDATTLWAIHVVLVDKLRWTDLRIEQNWSATATLYGQANGTTAAMGSSIRPPAAWLRNAIGNFEVDHCEFAGNLTDFPMSDGVYAWYGALGASGGSSIVGHLNIHDNVIHGYRRLLTIPPGTPSGQITIVGNEGYDFGADCVTFGAPINVVAAWNYFHSAWTSPSDPGHGDFFQSVFNGNTDLTNVDIYGNLMTPYRYDGVPAKHGYQGLYFDDVVAPGSFRGFRFYNNVLISDLFHGIQISRGAECHVWRNTLAKPLADAGGSNSAPWVSEGAGAVGNRFEANFASSFQLAADSGTVSAGNLASASSQAVYEANFVGPFTATRTRAEILARYAPKPGSPIASGGIGAIGSYIDFTARTVDLTGAPWLT